MKKGFIATSLIYSFFLIFCAVLLGYVAISLHNKNLINKTGNDLIDEFSRKDVRSAPLGSYFKISLDHPVINVSDVKWISVIHGNSVSNGTTGTYLISDSIVISNKERTKSAADRFNSINDLISGFDSCYAKSINVAGPPIISSIINSSKIDESLKKTILNIGIDYVLGRNQGSVIYYDTENSSVKNNGVASDMDFNVRLIMIVPSGLSIMGGNGTSNNPYILGNSDGTCYKDDTLVSRILQNGYDNKSSLTTPGKQLSTTDEGLRTTRDDYGISFYYRGSVQNNYIVFANMCWRIVRITGNGAVKIVLYNYNPDNDTEPCSVGEEETTNAFARYDSTTSGKAGKSRFNTANSNAYLGFMSGVASGETYEETHANTTDSTSLTNLKTWYDLVFTAKQKSMLADVIWCNDKSLATSTYNPNNWAFETYNTGIGRTSTYYASTERLHDVSTANPTLVCPNASTEDSSYTKISKFTASDTLYGNGALNGYKIGLLTADEVAYAGLIVGSNNNSNYLYSNTSGVTWMTLSPAYGVLANGQVFGTFIYQVGSDGLIESSSVAPTGFRPAVALDPSTNATGSGTQTDPYVVVE